MDSVKQLCEIVDGLERLAHRLSLESGESECQRKNVAAAMIDFVPEVGARLLWMRRNTPTAGWTCTNERGNCGCAHAEPRLVMDVLSRSVEHPPIVGMPVIGVAYSPCARCAHVVLESGIFKFCVYNTLTLHDTRGRDLLIRAGIPCFSTSELMAAFGDTTGCPMLADIRESFNDCLAKWCQAR